MSEAGKRPEESTTGTSPDGLAKKISAKASSGASEVVSLLCPVCDKPYKVARKMLGKEVECKDCGRTFTLKDPKVEEEKARKKEKPKARMVDDTFLANCKVCEKDTTHRFNHCTICGLTDQESGKVLDAGVTKLKSTVAVLIYLLIAIAIYWNFPEDRRGKDRPDGEGRESFQDRSYKGKLTPLEMIGDPEKR